MSDPERVHDAGLQSERTALAWHRSGLAFAGAGALLLHTGDLSHPARELPGVVGLAVAAAIMAAAHLRYRKTLIALRAGRSPSASLWLPTTLTIFVSLLGVAALVVVVTTP